MLQDSGARRQFSSGAVRDISSGKGRMDLIDIGCASLLLNGDPVLDKVDSFVLTKDPYDLILAMQVFISGHYPCTPTAIIEVSKQFEDGAAKYMENNWKRGIDLHCYIDSALRHYMKFLRGDKDEDHARAFLWNLMCGRWTLLNRPELDDIEVLGDTNH